MTKYNATRTTIDGHKFDSKKEAAYYCELRLRKMAKEFADFSLQPEFILLDPFTDATGKKHRAIKYRADFAITHHDGTVEVVDVKAAKNFTTDVYKIKKKLFLARYPEYKFTEVT